MAPNEGFETHDPEAQVVLSASPATVRLQATALWLEVVDSLVGSPHAKSKK